MPESPGVQVLASADATIAPPSPTATKMPLPKDTDRKRLPTGVLVHVMPSTDLNISCPEEGAVSPEARATNTPLPKTTSAKEPVVCGSLTVHATPSPEVTTAPSFPTATKTPLPKAAAVKGLVAPDFLIVQVTPSCEVRTCPPELGLTKIPSPKATRPK